MLDTFIIRLKTASFSISGDKLKALIEDKLADRTTAEWEALLIPAGVPCSAINNVAELKERHPEVFVMVGTTICMQAPLHSNNENVASSSFSRWITQLLESPCNQEHLLSSAIQS